MRRCANTHRMKALVLDSNIVASGIMLTKSWVRVRLEWAVDLQSTVLRIP